MKILCSLTLPPIPPAFAIPTKFYKNHLLSLIFTFSAVIVWGIIEPSSQSSSFVPTKVIRSLNSFNNATTLFLLITFIKDHLVDQ